LPRNFKNQKKTILDIACGKGFLLEKLSQNIKFKCFGIDLNIKNHTENNEKTSPIHIWGAPSAPC